jgi:hypothetical protein
MSSKLPAPLDICAAVAPFDRVINRRRSARVQNLADDARGAGPNARDPR